MPVTDQLDQVQRFFVRWMYHFYQFDVNHGFSQIFKHRHIESPKLRAICTYMVMIYTVMHRLNSMCLKIFSAIRYNVDKSFKYEVTQKQFCTRVSGDEFMYA